MTPATIKALAQAAEDALSEAMGAAKKFPNNNYMMTATGEEFGELCKALMEHTRDGSASPQEVYTEAMQLAAMAMRIAVEGDADYKYAYDPAFSTNFRPTGAPKPATLAKVRVERTSAPLTKDDADWIRRIFEQTRSDPDPDGAKRMKPRPCADGGLVSQDPAPIMMGEAIVPLSRGRLTAADLRAGPAWNTSLQGARGDDVVTRTA